MSLLSEMAVTGCWSFWGTLTDLNKIVRCALAQRAKKLLTSPGDNRIGYSQRMTRFGDTGGWGIVPLITTIEGGKESHAD